jgi:hypothetical protein
LSKRWRRWSKHQAAHHDAAPSRGSADLAAEHVSPTVKHKPIPRNGPILARDEGTLERIGIFAAPGKKSSVKNPDFSLD